MSVQKKRNIQTTLTKFYHQPVAKVSLELFLSVMAIMFFALFAIRPTLLTMSDLLKEIEDKEKLELQLQKKIAALSTAQTEYHQFQDRLHLLDEALPPTPQFINTLKILERMAGENRLVINDLSLTEIPEEIEVKQNVTPESFKRQDVEFRVSVFGDYVAIRDFVRDLQKSRRTIVVSSIDFRVNQNLGMEALQAVLTVNMPYVRAK